MAVSPSWMLAFKKVRWPNLKEPEFPQGIANTDFDFYLLFTKRSAYEKQLQTIQLESQKLQASMGTNFNNTVGGAVKSDNWLDELKDILAATKQLPFLKK